MAGELGFSCIQLPSKVLYASMGIDRGGLTRELADHLRAVLDEAGVSVAVLGCYKNLATPDRQQLMDNFAEYEACLNFAQMLGGCPVGTETGRPNAQNRVADDRTTDEALEAFMDGLAHVCDRAEAVGGQVLIESGWNETVNTPDRCREVLERVSSPSLGVIYDPVSLLHPSVVDEAQEITARMLYLCGSKIRVLHAKDLRSLITRTKPVGATVRAHAWCATAWARRVAMTLSPWWPGLPPPALGFPAWSRTACRRRRLTAWRHSSTCPLAAGLRIASYSIGFCRVGRLRLPVWGRR